MNKRRFVFISKVVCSVAALTAGAFTIGCASDTKVESTGPATAATKPATPVNPESAKLNAIITKFSETAKRMDAFDAAYFQVEENLGKFGDYLSPEYKEREKAMVKTALDELATVNPALLPPRDQTAYALFKGDIEDSWEGFKYPLELFAFNQMGNRLRAYIDDSSPALSGFPFDSAKHYRDFISRSEGFPSFVDRQIANLKEGAAKGYALNCVIAKNAIQTYKDALEPAVEKNPFYRPVLNMPKEISAADQKDIKAGFAMMVKDRILPSFQKFDQFYQTEYLPKCRKTFGFFAIPKGREMYRHFVRASTDVDMDPKKIHQIGLGEVARIRNEMATALAQLGLKGQLRGSLQKLQADPASYYTNVKDMFAAYDVFRAKVATEIPKAFSLQPTTDFKIVEAENPEDASGSYRVPTEFIPYGRFVANTKNLKATPRWAMNTLFLHEAIPGHHFHLALQYEMKDQLSEYQRKMFYSNAFTEGWALYAERWGREAGLVADPGQMVGSLSDEMLRAVRLVVDTGIHSMGWSRDKVMSYMRQNLASDDREIQIETDRYSVWPGQALGYKIGQLKILELREKAKKTLGAKFDIKEFHRTVLGEGTLSLPVLEAKVNTWIRTTADKKVKSTQL